MSIICWHCGENERPTEPKEYELRVLATNKDASRHGEGTRLNSRCDGHSMPKKREQIYRVELKVRTDNLSL